MALRQEKNGMTFHSRGIHLIGDYDGDGAMTTNDMHKSLAGETSLSLNLMSYAIKEKYHIMGRF